jgi:hypothetical protein
MDRKCKNCEYFRKGSVEPATHVWGDCVKPGKYSWSAYNTKIPGIFTWADSSCDDFEPRTTPAAQSDQDSGAS